MNVENILMKDTVSPDPQAPTLVVFGKTAGRMDEVIRLLRDMGGVSAYGSFTEAEALQRIATSPRLGAVLLGGGVEEASRLRIREELARNQPGVLTSEPGKQYLYSDENIVADVRAKLGAQPIRHGLTQKDEATVAAIRAQSAAFKGMMTGPEARGGYDAMIEAVPDAGEVNRENATVGGVGGVWCRPKDARGDAALLYLHGGAYVLGSARAYRHFAGQFAARTKIDAFVPDYGLAPERPFPAGVGDAHAVYRGLVASGVQKIAIVGDSVGGGLALTVLALAQADADAGIGLAPAACVVMSPWTDLALTGSTYATRAEEDPFVTYNMLKTCAGLYLGAQDPTHPLASPLYGKLSNLPPTQLHVGSSEVLLDDSLQYVQRARAQGSDATVHLWQGMPHVFPSNIGMLDAADEAMSIMTSFLSDRLYS
jgi:epsilon-lactone hydrolase